MGLIPNSHCTSRRIMLPNIIVLVPHDTGQFISPYGIDTVDTPAAERLAREGVRFANHFCTSPLCSPSRAAMLTGRYTHQNGVHGLVNIPILGDFDLADSEGERHLVSYLRDAGYQSVLIGGMHESKYPDRLGFDGHDWNSDIRDTPPTMDRWLAERDRDRPFYIQIGSHETHRDWTRYSVEPYDEKGVYLPPYLKDSEQLRQEMAEMQGATNRYDRALGQVLDILDKHDVAENTIVVATTDHGIDFPRVKGAFYDRGIEALMLIRYPAGNWGKGRVIDELSSHIDLVPTLLEALGISPPENLAGRSYLPLLEGRAYTENETIFAEKTFHDSYDPTRSVRTKEYKYIRYFEAHIYQDLRSATVPRYHMLPGDGEPWMRVLFDELYDLEKDPWETNNLVFDPGYADIKKEMRRKLARWMIDTEDPLIDGPIASPFHRRQMQRLLETY